MRRAPILVAVVAVVFMGTSCNNAATATKTPQTHHATDLGAGSFSGTYALAAKPGFCGPSGNHPDEVMYVDGADVTVPGDVAGAFTGTATRQGTAYHLVLVQPANEIMDDITMTVSGGGDSMAGTGQENLEAGNNPSCPISFTGHRTSTSIPPSTSTSVAPVPTAAPPTSSTSSTTSTTVAPASQITLASLDDAAAARSGLGTGTRATCGPGPTGLGVGSYVACALFNANVGGAEEILQITGTSPSSFNVVIGPGSDIGCSELNAGELAALKAQGRTCDPSG
jgi:hypothetical protein